MQATCALRPVSSHRGIVGGRHVLIQRRRDDGALASEPVSNIRTVPGRGPHRPGNRQFLRLVALVFAPDGAHWIRKHRSSERLRRKARRNGCTAVPRRRDNIVTVVDGRGFVFIRQLVVVAKDVPGASPRRLSVDANRTRRSVALASMKRGPRRTACTNQSRTQEPHSPGRWHAGLDAHAALRRQAGGNAPSVALRNR